MDKKRQDLYEKLAKLIELRDGTNFDGERTAAERAIANLLAQYGLELGKLRVGQEIIIKEINRASRRRDNKEFYLFGFIAEFCGTALFSSSHNRKTSRQTSYKYVGREVNIECVIFLTDVIKRQIDTMLVSFGKTGINVINSYKLGLIQGVKERFNEISAEVLQYQRQEGLVPVSEFKCRHDEARDFFLNKEKCTPGRKILITNDSAYLAGVDDSQKINIHAPVNSSCKPLGITHV